jgi:predicted chitinase
MGTGSRVTRWAIYYGRGWVQETWLANYARLSIAASLHFGRAIDLVNDPDLLSRDRALMAWSVWEGFVTGRWTGQNLADHIRPGAVDYVGARRIVNGTDQAELIAGHARRFEAALALLEAEPAEPALCDACPHRRTA